MKKSLPTLTALAFVGAPTARTSGSSVAVWGVINADQQHLMPGLNAANSGLAGGWDNRIGYDVGFQTTF